MYPINIKKFILKHLVKSATRVAILTTRVAMVTTRVAKITTRVAILTSKRPGTGFGRGRECPKFARELAGD